MAVCIRIVVDDDARAETPGLSYTAKAFDIRGNQIVGTGDGIGSTLIQSVEDLLQTLRKAVR